MNGKKKIIFGAVFFLIMLILTAYMMFKDTSLTTVISIIMKLNFGYIVIALILVLVYLSMQGIYMKMVLKYLKQKTTFIKCFIYSCIEFYFSGITPSSTGGQPFQAYYMAKDGIPVLKSSIVLIINTLTFKLVLIILGILFVLLRPTLIFFNGTIFNIFLGIGLIINLAMVVGCISLMYSKKIVKSILLPLIRILGKFRLIKDYEGKIKNLDKTLNRYTKYILYMKKNWWLTTKVTLLTLVQRIAMFFIPYLIYLSLGYREYGFIDFLAIQTAIAIAIDSLPLPGGVGICEVLMLSIYAKMFSEGILTSAIILIRSFSFYSCFIISALTTLANHMRLLICNNKEEKIK